MSCNFTTVFTEAELRQMLNDVNAAIALLRDKINSGKKDGVGFSYGDQFAQLLKERTQIVQWLAALSAPGQVIVRSAF